LEASICCKEGTYKYKDFKCEIGADEGVDWEHSKHVEDRKKVVEEGVEQSEGRLRYRIENKRENLDAFKDVEFSIIPGLSTSACVEIIHFVDAKGTYVLKERATLNILVSSLHIYILLGRNQMSLFTSLGVIGDKSEHILRIVLFC